ACRSGRSRRNPAPPRGRPRRGNAGSCADRDSSRSAARGGRETPAHWEDRRQHTPSTIRHETTEVYTRPAYPVRRHITLPLWQASSPHLNNGVFGARYSRQCPRSEVNRKSFGEPKRTIVDRKRPLPALSAMLAAPAFSSRKVCQHLK